jgi:hypothetical protein
VPGDDRLRRLVCSQAAHRSELVFELTAIGLDRVVGVPSTWCHADGISSARRGVDRGASVTTSLGVTFTVANTWRPAVTRGCTGPLPPPASAVWRRRPTNRCRRWPMVQYHDTGVTPTTGVAIAEDGWGPAMVA